MSNLLQPMPNFEPLRQNRFFMRFPSSLGIAEWYVSTSSRPKINIEETEIQFLNTSTYVAGRFTWDTITVKLRDPIGPSASQAIQEWIRLCAESVTGRMGYAVGYRKNVDIEMLDPTGVPVQKWTLENAWISSGDYGSLDYSSSEIAEIDITLRFDRAILIY
jgi:hypothetical protein